MHWRKKLENQSTAWPCVENFPVSQVMHPDISMKGNEYLDISSFLGNTYIEKDRFLMLGILGGQHD